MSLPNQTVQLAATNDLGWCVFSLPQQAVQVDFGTSGLVMSQAAYTDLLRIAQGGLIAFARDQLSNGSLAQTTLHRQVLWIEDHQVFAVCFDGAIFRFDADHFVAFVDLILNGGTALQLLEAAYPAHINSPTQSFSSFSLN
jgi:hypothetical protein